MGEVGIDRYVQLELRSEVVEEIDSSGSVPCCRRTSSRPVTVLTDEIGLDVQAGSLSDAGNAGKPALVAQT